MFYLLVIVIIISFWIAIKLSFRISGKENKSILFIVFLSMLVACLNILIVGLSLTIFQENFKVLFESNEYKAIVVGNKENLFRSNFGNSTTQHISYAPIVKFKDKNENVIILETNLYSSKKSLIGSEKLISYSNDSLVHDISIISIMLLFGGIIFIGVLITFLYLLVSFTFGVEKSIRIKYAKKIFLFIAVVDLLLIIVKFFLYY